MPTRPGTYNLTLTVSTTQRPGILHSKIVPIRIEAPAASITHPEVEAIFNYPLRLQARPIGKQRDWSPALNLIIVSAIRLHSVASIAVIPFSLHAEWAALP